MRGREMGGEGDGREEKGRGKVFCVHGMCMGCYKQTRGGLL